MSKLLRRMASELLEAREQTILGDWSYIDDYTAYFDDACMVIKGYQKLLQDMLSILDQGSFHRATTVSNLEFVIEGETLVNQLLIAIAKAKASLPEEKVHE